MPESQRASDWLTPHQYADKYHVSVNTVWRWLQAGQIKGKKFGPRIWRVYDPKEAAK